MSQEVTNASRSPSYQMEPELRSGLPDGRGAVTASPTPISHAHSPQTACPIFLSRPPFLSRSGLDGFWLLSNFKPTITGLGRFPKDFKLRLLAPPRERHSWGLSLDMQT